MVKRRTHNLTFTWVTTTTDEETGKISVKDSANYSGKCSVFLNGKSSRITSGGVARAFSYLIIADAGVQIPEGARVEINGREFEVIAVDPLQKHTEVWV